MKILARPSLLVLLLLAAGCTAETSASPPTAVAQSAETAATSDDAGPAGPFDRHAAWAAIKGIDAHPCVAAETEGASCHVVVTFAPDGQAANVAVDDGPTVGTATGACVAARFRRASVPAFHGEPVRVGYAFVLR